MEVVEVGFSIKKKEAKRKVIGGFGDVNVTDACISPESVQTSVNEAMSFEEGFAAIIKAGLSGLAFNVLQPYLEILQEKFLESQLMSATEKGKESACATPDEVEVTYRRLFDDPNPENRPQMNPEDYARFSNEPSAVARNIFSDLFPRDNTIRRKLTEQEWDTLAEDLKSDPLRSMMPEFFGVSDSVWLKSELPIARFMALQYREILSRFDKAGIPATGILHFISDLDEHHYDGDLCPEYIQVLVPLTDTIGTILRSCQTEDFCGGRAADLENTPRLGQGDAQFFHGCLVLHEAPRRAKGDVWMLVTLENKENFTIREVIERLEKAKK